MSWVSDLASGSECRMPAVTREWVTSLERRDLHKIFALGGYNQRAQLLFIETNEWFHAHFAPRIRKTTQQDIFQNFFFPYYSMWASMAYVVHEGFVELDITDKKLSLARLEVDMSLLRRFRNATFHFQPRLRTEKHSDLIDQRGFLVARHLHERQDFLTRKLIRLTKHNQHFGSLDPLGLGGGLPQRV